jgi:DNA polymerase III epsilon subunit
MDAREVAERNLIFKAVTGSRAYGTSTPHSDIDIRGVFAADPISVMTPFYGMEEVEVPGEDTKLYELCKYVGLVCAQNPNIVELLWVDRSDVLFESPAWALLRDRRAELLTTKVRATYGGFATQALKGMKGHDRWLNKPQPEQPPVPADFLLMTHNVALGREWNHEVPRDGAWTAVSVGQDSFLLFEGGNGSWFDAAGNLRTFTREQAREQAQNLLDGRPPAALVRFDRKNYEERKRDHQNYWTWRRERNKTRGALEERRGFDGKNAGHLIRLLRTAKEILEEGVVRVRRPDAAELLEVREEWSYERVMDEAARLEACLDDAERSSSLPRTLDQAFVGNIVMEMYERTWRSAAARSGVPVLERPFESGGPPDPRGRVVVADFEFTGWTDPGRFRLVEMAAVEIVGGRATGRSFHSYVDPGARINPFARKIHGLTASFLRGKPTFAEAAPRFLDFVGDAPLVFHNAATDMRMFNHDMRLAGMVPVPPDRIACTDRLARGLFGVQMGVDGLCDQFGLDRVPRERGHGALVDATLLAECLLRMARMPGYAAADRYWLRQAHIDGRRDRAAARRREMLDSPDFCVDAEVRDEVAAFTLADGRILEAPLPPMPPGYVAVRAPEGAAIVVAPAGAAGRRGTVPENPEGPALLTSRSGEVMGVWFEGGRPVRREPISLASTLVAANP